MHEFIHKQAPPPIIPPTMHAFICSRGDYCSAIYAGVALAHVDQLQSFLNAAVRLIGGIPKFGHISEFIRAELHWLPMHRCIAFKILMLMRNCLAGQAPVYRREICVPVSSLPGRRSLRSAKQGDLVVSRVRLTTAHRRSFAVVGPSFLNALPIAASVLNSLLWLCLSSAAV